MNSESFSWKRKLALKVTFAVAVIVFAAAAVYIFAPTDRTWQETKRALEARGEVLDWEKMIPPPIPAEENLFEDPVAASLLPLKGQPAPLNPLGVGAPTLPPGSEVLGTPFEMSNLLALAREPGEKTELSLTELHDWFAQWDESFERLRQAGKRPKARLKGDYTSPANAPMPNFVAARTFAQLLGSRARVNLLLGKSAEAFKDLETLNVLMQSLDTQPGTLVSAMIHVAIAGLYLQTVEDGLEHKLWGNEELTKLTGRLLEMNVMRVVENGFRAERAGVLRHLEALAKRRKDPVYTATLEAFTSSGWSMEKAVMQFAPASWVRRNQANFAWIIQGYLDGIDSSRRTMDTVQLDQINTEVNKLTSRWTPKNALLLYVTPNFSKAAQTMARNQNRAHELAVLCAMEAYRSSRGEYPKALVELVPEFMIAIPTNVFSRRPIKYESIEGQLVFQKEESNMEHPPDTSNHVWIGESARR